MTSIDLQPSDEKFLADFAMDVFLAAAPPPPVVWDVVIPTTGLFIDANNIWIPAHVGMWRSWTGRRAVWGHEFHGPVYVLDGITNDRVYTGSRVCLCPKCQETVSPAKRQN